MARPKTKGVEEIELNAIVKALKKETSDTVYHLTEDVYLKRKKGTTEVVLHRDGRELNLDKATIEDFEFMYVKDFLEAVLYKDKLEIDETLFYDDKTISNLSRVDTLTLIDKITYNHCVGCPITLKKETNISLSSYCSVSCNVGVELQSLGGVFEKYGRTRMDRGRRDKTSKTQGKTPSPQGVSVEEIKCIRDSIEVRRFKAVKVMYVKLVSPKGNKKGKDERE